MEKSKMNTISALLLIFIMIGSMYQSYKLILNKNEKLDTSQILFVKFVFLCAFLTFIIILISLFLKMNTY